MIILAIIAMGMFAGWLAQLILGRRSDTTDWTLALVAGLTGSVIGGTLSNLLAGEGFKLGLSGFFGMLVGAIIVSGGWQLYQRSR